MRSRRVTPANARAEDLPPTTVFLDTETEPVAGTDTHRLVLLCWEVWATSRKTGLPVKKNGLKGVSTTRHWSGHGKRESDFYELLAGIGPARVVAHNWDFDALVLRVGSRATTTRYGYHVAADKGIYPPTSAGFSPFWVVLRWKAGHCSELVCNTNFHKCSLKSLGKAVGTAKLTMPSATDSAALLTYCKNDVEILRKGWFLLFQFSQDVAGTTPGLTVAQMAMRCWLKRWFPPQKSLRIRGSLASPDAALAEQDAYHGGRTEVFWRGVPPRRIELRKYDVNSMYPSCMTGLMPIELIGPGKLAPGCLADVTVSIPPDGLGWLGWEGVFIHERGLVFPAGTFRVTTWWPLIEIALEQGWIKQVHRCWHYVRHPLFRSYVTDVFSLRRESTGATRLLYKYLLNSLYGKFGQGTFGRWSRTKAAGDGRWQDEDGTEWWGVNGEAWRWTPPEPGMGAKSVCAIAGWITAAARAKLWRAMADLRRQGATVFMCDTDSIITDGTLPTGKGLGEWDLEAVSDAEDCWFTAPKHYLFARAQKCKGIRAPQPGVATYEQAQFGKWRTCFMGKRTVQTEQLEAGARVSMVSKTVTGAVHKRILRGDGQPTDPIVLP